MIECEYEGDFTLKPKAMSDALFVCIDSLLASIDFAVSGVHLSVGSCVEYLCFLLTWFFQISEAILFDGFLILCKVAHN